MHPTISRRNIADAMGFIQPCHSRSNRENSMSKKLMALNAVAWTLSILLTASAPAQDKEEKKEAGPLLKVGDKAPGLTATRWLQGSEVKECEKGKIYGVE